MLDLALYGGDNPVPLRITSRRQHISLKYLEHLARRLKENGLIISRRGPCGGHRLARSADEISIGEIVRCLEEKTALTKCSETEDTFCRSCDRAGECLSRWVWVEASQVMFERLNQITLGMLIRDGYAQKPRAGTTGI